MSETTSLPTRPPPAAKKAKVKLGRPRMGEIYLEEEYDFNDVFSGEYVTTLPSRS